MNAAAKASTKPCFSGSATSRSFQAARQPCHSDNPWSRNGTFFSTASRPMRGLVMCTEPTRRGQEGECSGAAWYDPTVNPRGKGARAILTFSITVDIDGSGPTQHGPTASCGDPARVPECSQGVTAAVSQRG